MRALCCLPIAAALAIAGCSEGPPATGRGGAGGGTLSGLAGSGGGGGGASGIVGTAGGSGSGGGGATGGGGSGGTGGQAVDGIVVNTPSGRIATENAADGNCDILEAVAAASTGQSVHECANPNGSTRIILTGGSAYPTGKTLRFATATNQPIRIGIADGTTGSATIDAAGGWVVDPTDPPTSCLLNVSGGASVELSDVTLTQAAFTLTGACVTRGSITIERGRVTGFRRGGASATCLPASGCDNNADANATATLLLRNSLVDGNSTDGDGGGITSAGFGALLVVYHSSIVGNTAAGAGGGLFFGGGWNTHVIRASTVSGNRASVGGGVMVKFACSNTYLNVFNSTIANNTADGTGGGIEFEPADRACATQDVVVISSVVAGNHSLSSLESNINAGWWTADPMGNLGIFTCQGGSLIYIAPGYPRPTEPDAPCLLATRDPHIGPLAPMGGLGDLPVHPLLAGSPAIDAAGDAMLDDERDQWIPLIDPPLQPPADEWQVFDRLVDGDGDGTAGADLGAIEMNARAQTELLAVAAKGPSPHQIVMTPSGFDRGAGTQYAAAGATNQLVTYRLPIGEPGFYDFTVGVLNATDGGQFQMAIADGPNGPWTDLGPPQDTYAPNQAFAALGPFAGPLLATTGERYVRFTVLGRNAASGGYHLSFDYIDARKRTTPCPVVQIASGARHTCALTSAGGARCWGANDAGQLGDGSMTTAVRVPALDALTGVKAIATGARHTCALTTAGGVRCWGANDAGQLGDGSMNARAAPPTTDVLTGVAAIAAGGSVTCALTTAGGVRCWGDNTFGQLGDGTTDNRAAPPANDVIANAASISVASGHACAVTTTGGARCWGHNGNGELGDGTYFDEPSPPAADVLAGAVSVAAAANFTCAVTATGGERCWGANDIGQLGDDTEISVDRLSPATMDNLGGVRAMALGTAYTCALMTGGGVRCWGANDAGQLGDGLAPDFASAPPTLDIAGFTGTCQ